MGKLVIDGNSVFEIDEACVKKRKIPKECDIEKYLKENSFNKKNFDSSVGSENLRTSS